MTAPPSSAPPGRPRSGPLRVVHVVDALDVGGISTLVLGLARRADRRWVIPSILCTDRPGRLAGSVSSTLDVVSAEAAPGLDWRAISRMRRSLAHARAEVVHSHNQRPHLLSMIAGALARTPIAINTRHGLHRSGNRPYDQAGILRRRLLGRTTDAVVAVSRAVREFSMAVDGLGADKVQVILNGTELEAPALGPGAARRALGLPEGAFVVGTVGRIVPERDYLGLAEAIRIALREVPGLHGVVIGDGPLLDALRARARELGIAERLRLPGYRADAVQLLRAFDVFALPSLTEGIGLALLEAMAAGLPAVATTVGGNPEVLEGSPGGRLVPPADAVALADAVVSLARDPAACEAGGEANRRIVASRFSIEATARAYERLYWDLARAKGIRA